MPLTAVACGAAIVIPLSSHGPGSNAHHGNTADVAAASAQPATTGAATPTTTPSGTASGTPSAPAPAGTPSTAPTTAPAGPTQSAPPAPQAKPDQDNAAEALSISTENLSQHRVAPAYVPRHAAPVSTPSSSSSSSSSTGSSSAGSSGTTTTAPATSKAAIAIAFAKAQLGKPYAWGGNGPNSWDCSGLVQAAYAKAGITLPRVTYDQVTASPRVSTSDLQPGDLIFYYSGASHVGIYIGNGQIIHAPHTGAVVEIAPYNEMPIYGATRPSA